MEAPPEPRSRRRARALPPQHVPAMASHVASTWPRPCCTAQPPPAALYARTTVRLRLWVPSMGTDKMPVRPGRPCAAMAMATRLMAETGMMMPASGSDGSCWSKVAEMQQLRMPPHERQWSTTLLPLSRSRTPPSRSQHLHSCTLEDRVAARISLLGRGCGALGAERGNKTSERLFRPFCPLLDPPRFRTSVEAPAQRHRRHHAVRGLLRLGSQAADRVVAGVGVRTVFHERYEPDTSRTRQT